MDSILIPWETGAGNIVISNNGGDFLISSDTPNNGMERSQILTFRTTSGNVTATLTVIQLGNKIVLRDSRQSILRDNKQKILTALKQ